MAVSCFRQVPLEDQRALQVVFPFTGEHPTVHHQLRPVEWSFLLREGRALAQAAWSSPQLVLLLAAHRQGHLTCLLQAVELQGRFISCQVRRG